MKSAIPAEERIYTLYINKEKVGVFTMHTMAKFIFGRGRNPQRSVAMIGRYAIDKRKIKASRTQMNEDCHVRVASTDDKAILANDNYYLFTDKYNEFIFDSFTSFNEYDNIKSMSAYDKKTKYNNGAYLKWLEDNDSGEFHSIQFQRFIKSVPK